MIDYQIHKDNIFIWDYTDVLQTRAIGTDTERDDAISNLQGRFGKELVKEVIERRIKNGETYEIMGKAYLQFPDLYFLSADFQAETIERFKKDNMYREKQGFSLGSIFKLKPEHTVRDIRTSDNKIKRNAWLAFENSEHPRNIVSLLTPSDQMNKFITQGDGGEPLVQEAPGLEPSILGRIDKLSRSTDTRFSLSERPTILMFMPVGGSGSNIRHLLPAWGSLLMDHKWWSDRYEVVCVMDEDTLKEENVGALLQDEREQGQPVEILNNITIIQSNPKVNILTLERKLKCSESKKGLVILAGDKLSMGVSLPCTDVVMLLNDSKSPDDIIQKMYRALTPSRGKKASFVVDINPVRTLAAVYGYTRASHETLNNKSELLDIVTDVYSWDADIFEFSVKRGSESRPLDFQARMKQLIDEAETDQDYRIMDNIGGFEKRVENNIRRRLHTNASATELIKSKFSERDSRIISTIGLRNKSTFSLQKGTLIIKQPRVSPAEGNETQGSVEKQEDLELIIANFAETVTDFIKYLAITTSKNTLEEAIDEFESKAVEENTNSRLDSNVIKLVRDRSLMKGVISDDMLSKLLVQAVKEFAMSSSREVFRQMKGKIDEPSLRKDAVLQVIYKHITPKKRQKEESGEVFTPIELINDMLDKLPRSIWKKHDIKILDPANGIGNFPVVAFYKLDEGLKSWEPNEKKRRNHIINNMLYMIEYQSNNSRIAKNIFKKICDGCKPNIWTTDSLTVTKERLNKNGWPDVYDIVIGNPPYNTKGMLKGGGAPWPKFVNLAFELIKPGGYITFVHPPGWRMFYNPEDRDNQGKLLHTIREKGWSLDYINVTDKPPKHFPIVDYYLIHAKASDGITKYDSNFMGNIDKGESRLDYSFIPSMLNKEVFSILDKLFKAKGEPIKIVYNQSFKPGKSDKTIPKKGSPCDRSKPGLPHYHFTSKSGEKEICNKVYDDVPVYIDSSKVIMTFKAGYEKGKLFAFYSDKQMGTTNNTMYMLTNGKNKEEHTENGNKLVDFFNSDIITFLMKITQYSAPPNHINQFKILNQLQMPESLDDYKLTEEELELIKKVVGKKEEVETEENDDEPESKEGGSRRFTRRKPRI